MSEQARIIQRQLVKNQGILQKHLKERRSCVVDRDQLLRDGFSFTLITHLAPHRERGNLRCCFDLGYCVRGGKKVAIVRQGVVIDTYR